MHKRPSIFCSGRCELVDENAVIEQLQLEMCATLSFRQTSSNVCRLLCLLVGTTLITVIVTYIGDLRWTFHNVDHLFQTSE